MRLRIDILSDAIAKLNAVGRPVGVPEAELGRGGEAALPSVLVYWTEDASRPIGTSRRAADYRELVLLVECRATSETPLGCYEAVEPLISWVAAALDGQLLTGAVREVVQLSQRAEMLAEAQAHILVSVEFRVAYQQKVGDATQAA